MKYIEKYNEFIRVFQIERDFFKCHEILEDIWIDETSCNTRNHVAINLLLISVGALHWERGNLKGALAVFRNSLNYFDENKNKIDKLGIDSLKLKKIVEESIKNIEKKEIYKDISLPMKKSPID